MSLKLTNVLWVDEARDGARARCASARREGTRVRVHCDVWVDKDDGTRILLGDASALEISVKRGAARPAAAGALARRARGARLRGPRGARRALGRRRLDRARARRRTRSRRSSAIALALGHVHHGLRGAEADADEAFVRSLGAALGVPVLVRARGAAPPARERARAARGPTLQEAARRLRYDALRELAAAAGAERIATAHTLDDQAETVLLRLLRGSGPERPRRHPRALAGRPHRAAAARGLARRDRTIRARRGVCSGGRTPRNRDPAYARARLRHDWLRGSRRGLQSALAQGDRRSGRSTAQGIGMDRAARRQEAEARLARDGEGWTPRLHRLGATLPAALARRLARRALHDGGCGAGCHAPAPRAHAGLPREAAGPARCSSCPAGSILERGAGPASACGRVERSPDAKLRRLPRFSAVCSAPADP